MTDIIDYIYQRGVHAKPKPPSGKGVQYVITTYNRPRACRRLLADIVRTKGNAEVHVSVFDDASTEDYSEVREMCDHFGWQYVRAKQNHGRQGAWKWISAIFARQKRARARCWIFLPDDVRLCEGFLKRALTMWRKIDDAKKATLVLLTGETREGPSWTNVRPERRGLVDRTQWVELACLMDRRTLEALEYKLDAVPARRWTENPNASSGVGQQLSQRLHSKGFSMYRAHESLVVHLDGQSQMNPERPHSMQTLRFVDGRAAHRALVAETPVVVSLATIVARVDAVAEAVRSLYWQADRVNVYLNGHGESPAGIRQLKRVSFARSKSHGDNGDAGKFWWADKLGEDTYHLTVDDDLRYPANYVYQMTEGIERYGRRAIVGLHGALIVAPERGYYHCRELMHCLSALDEPTAVHLLGTGTVAYHTSAIEVSPADFKAPNMADLWFAKRAQEQQVPMVALERPKNWLKTLSIKGSTIWQRYKGKAHEQDALVRSVGWRVYPVPPMDDSKPPRIRPQRQRPAPAAPGPHRLKGGAPAAWPKAPPKAAPVVQTTHPTTGEPVGPGMTWPFYVRQ